MVPAASPSATQAAAAQSLAPYPQVDWAGIQRQLDAHIGEMGATVPGDVREGRADAEMDARLRFEPLQMIEDLFRDDVVLVMRAGPSEEDAAEGEAVAAAGSADQSELCAAAPLSVESATAMRDLGTLMAVNGLVPQRVVASPCGAAGATADALFIGLAKTDARAAGRIARDDADAMLGADAIRDHVEGCSGGTGKGPLLVVTDYDAIEGLTGFNTYPGEMLVLNPARDTDRSGRVLGYVRLGGAGPDAARFGPVAESLVAAPADGTTMEAGKMTAPSADGAEADALAFAPRALADRLDDPDIVIVMRHGPTDWSVRDAAGVDPTDCAGQRVLSPEGEARMRRMGALLAANGIRPGAVRVSEWCRNTQTWEALRAGMATVDPDYAAGLEAVTDPDLNLLLSVGGAPDVDGLRARVAAWDGTVANGEPVARLLLLLTHFTNIQELTQYSALEGEALVIDPAVDAGRGGRVIGWLRLESAVPDVGHFE